MYFQKTIRESLKIIRNLRIAKPWLECCPCQLGVSFLENKRLVSIWYKTLAWNGIKGLVVILLLFEIICVRQFSWFLLLGLIRENANAIIEHCDKDQKKQLSFAYDNWSVKSSISVKKEMRDWRVVRRCWQRYKTWKVKNL